MARDRTFSDTSVVEANSLTRGGADAVHAVISRRQGRKSLIDLQGGTRPQRVRGFLEQGLAP